MTNMCTALAVMLAVIGSTAPICMAMSARSLKTGIPNCDMVYDAYSTPAMENKCPTDGNGYFLCESTGGCRPAGQGPFPAIDCASEQCWFQTPAPTIIGCPAPQTNTPWIPGKGPYEGGTAAGAQVCPQDGSIYYYCANSAMPAGPSPGYPASGSAGQCSLNVPFVSGHCDTGPASQCSARITHWCVDYSVPGYSSYPLTSLIQCPSDGQQHLYCRDGAAAGGCRSQATDGFFPYSACQFQCIYQNSAPSTCKGTALTLGEIFTNAANALTVGPETSAACVTLSPSGSFMSGAWVLNNTPLPSVPFLVGANGSAATWIMAVYDDVYLKMVQLQVVVVGGTASVYADAGAYLYVGSPLPPLSGLSHATVMAAWNNPTSSSPPLGAGGYRVATLALQY